MYTYIRKDKPTYSPTTTANENHSFNAFMLQTCENVTPVILAICEEVIKSFSLSEKTKTINVLIISELSQKWEQN